MTIKNRMKKAITAKTQDRTRYVQLKEVTGISGDIWKNFWFDRREPDARMVETIARAWPEYAYWLVTGATDVVNGHQCPAGAFCIEQNAMPLVTADAFLKVGAEIITELEKVNEEAPDDSEAVHEVVQNFLLGKPAHVMPSLGYALLLDGLFKKIRTFNQTSKIRRAEAQMKLTNDDQTS